MIGCMHASILVVRRQSAGGRPKFLFYFISFICLWYIIFVVVALLAWCGLVWFPSDAAVVSELG
jgi:hypothetical protein